MRRARLVSLWPAAGLCLLLLAFTIACAAPGVRAPAQAAATSGRDGAMSRQRPAESPKPDPKLSPEEVIRIQLEALRDNDTPEKDSGIARAFEFASPGNRAATGPLDNFIQLVKSPAYRPMLNHRRAERGQIRVTGDEARQRVTLTDARGRKITYIFILSRQQEEPYAGCWMTDSVIRVPDSNEADEGLVAGNGHLRGGGRM